jgi:histidinol-phosphate/aromatic aminotransferase/cobyric acid decarboxylase-like protein
VWDEAFYPLATGRWTRGDEHSWRLGSLTKLWACPGVRLGYVIAPTPHVAKTLRDRQPRWSVSGLAAAAVPRLLDHTDLEGWRNQIASTRDELADELGRIGFIVEATDANWLLVRRPGLRRDLLLGADPPVLVRDCTSFGLTDVHRVAIPRPHQIEAVLAAFTRVGP